MRTISFGDVLDQVAYRLGLDPNQSGLLTDQAVPIGTYIDRGVGKAYDSEDYPEWTLLHEFIPDANHIVTWDAIANEVTPVAEFEIGRTFKVYLIDPRTTDAPISTRFTLNNVGIHVGYDHGVTVWIEFMTPPPRFTSDVWSAGIVYTKNQVVYSFRNRECFKSKANNNHAHDPGDLLGLSMSAVTTQNFAPPQPAIPAQPQIMHVDWTIVTPLNVGQKVIVGVTQNSVLIANEIFTSVNPATAPVDAFTALRNQLIAVLPGTYTVTVDGPNHKLTFQDTAGPFFVDATWVPGADVALPVFQDQVFIPSVPSIPAVRQITEITFPPGQSIGLATYRLIVADGTGAEHSIEYVSLANDTGIQIILGLIQAITDSTDPFFGDVFSSIDTTSVKLILSFNQAVSVDMMFIPSSSPWWELVPFPMKIADEVIDYAYSTLFKEWGQTDKGMAEQQLADVDKQLSVSKLTFTPEPPLTGQQRKLSRYKLP